MEIHLNLDKAIDSVDCTLEFDKHIRVTLEHHNGCVYIFSPVMAIIGELSVEFFASLLQVQLYWLKPLPDIAFHFGAQSGVSQLANHFAQK